MKAILTVVLVLIAPAWVVASPLATGRMRYQLSWNGIPAASATVDVSLIEQEPEPLYHVEAMAQTSWLVDLLWQLRAYVGASFGTEGPEPFGFRYDRKINDDHSITQIEFDPKESLAVGTLDHRGKKQVVDVRDTNVVDPITAIFHALSRPIHLGDTVHYEIFTGEARYRVELRVKGEGPVTVAAGTYPAWEVEPRIWKVGTGLDRRLKGATIWVSQEPVRTILRIRSEVFIGAVNCDLQQLPQAVAGAPVPGGSSTAASRVAAFLMWPTSGQVSRR